MKYISVILVLLISLVVLHALAIHFYFYWTIWWYDIMMHVLGGLAAGFITLAICTGRIGEHVVPDGKLLLYVALGSIFIGILWETYEYTTGVTFVTAGDYAFDTVADLLCDISGGLIAYLAHTNVPKS